MKICAPFAGIVRYQVAEGQRVDTGAVLAIVESVKLEAPVVSPGPGVVGQLTRGDFEDVTGGDTLLELGEK
ncbi:acetyl-CoA carboxylase biotin carboxyl carrier protein subunit [Staphylococcus chromogenes]|nr:acetyl-CoA carboxylase biotin carboxyl carrier protein subunit [Staphylococcus chromogenes]